MSQFYGTLSGQAKTTATRRGGKTSGITTKAASWAGCISVTVYERDGVEYFSVDMESWQGRGDRAPIAHGEIGKAETVTRENGRH